MVFIAYGVDFPFLKRKDLAGLDLRGKIVVLRDGPPPRSARTSGRKRKPRSSVLRGLIARGAAGIVTISQDTETITFAELADYLTRRQIEPESEQEMPDVSAAVHKRERRGCGKALRRVGSNTGGSVS